MSKVIIFSDWHIHDYKQYNKDGSRLDNTLRVLDAIGVLSEQTGINKVIFAGDLYDTQKVLLTVVVNKTVKKFKEFFEKHPDITFYAISGNHDYATKNLKDSPAVTALSHLETIFKGRFVVFDNQSIEIEKGIWIHGVPYYEYKEHFDWKLQDRVNFVNDLGGERQDPDKHYLFIHQTPKGLGNEMIPYDVVPRDKNIKVFEHTYCGHIHERQELEKWFTIVGNSIHRDLADAGKKKGVLVTNLAKPEKGNVFVPLKGFPEFVLVPEDDITDELENSNDFIVPQVSIEKVIEQDVNVENFTSDLRPAQLVENFWREVDGKDEVRLKVGLSLVMNLKA